MDNDNQNRPGTAYQPGQQTQPGYPPQPMQPPPPQQQPGNYQVPYPQSPQQPPLQTQTTNQTSGRFAQNKNIQKLIVIVTVLLAIIALGLFLFTGQDLSRVESDELNFSVDLPADWENSISSSQRLSIVNASPTNRAVDEETSIVVSREITSTNLDEFIADGERSLTALQSDQAQEAFGISLGDVTVEEVGDDEVYGEKTTYRQTNIQTGIDYTVVKYRFLESENSIVVMRFLYSDAYPQVADWIAPIRASYTPID